jgi:ABC-type lipoprotein release transport system permease subunit
MGVITKIALRNMKRRKVRYILTVITLIISVALFGGVMIVSDSFNEMMLKSIDEQMGTADILIKPANSTGGWFNSTEINDDIKSVNHVNFVAYRITGFNVYASPTNSGNQVDNSTRTGVNGLDPQDVDEQNLGAQPYIIDSISSKKSVEKLLEYIDEKNGDKVVVISESLKIQLGKDFNVGDSIWILPNEGELLGYNTLDTGTWLEYTVVAIIRDSGEARDFDPENPSETSFFGGGGGGGQEVGIFANINNTHELVDGTENHTNEFNLCVVGTPNIYSVSSVTKNIETNLASIDDERDWKVNDLKTDSLETVNTTMSIFETMFLMFGLISLILSIVLMMNIFNIIKKEQEYETGMLQAIGASKSETFKLFLTQGTVMGIIGASIGTVFSYLISYVIFSVSYQTIQSLTSQTGGFSLSGFEIILYPATLILTFVVGLVSCIVAALYPSWKASRKPIIECLNPIEEKSKREKKHYWRRVILFIVGGLIIFMGFWLMWNEPESTGSFSPGEGMPSGMAVGMFAPIFVLFGIIWLMALSIKPLNKAFIILFSPYLKKTKLLTEKNMLKHRKRTTLTYVMIALTTSFLIGMSVMMDSIRAGIDTTVNGFMGANVRVYTFNTPRSFETGLLNQTGVADVMGVSHQNAQININGDWVGHSLLDSDWNETIAVNVVDTEKIKEHMTSTTIVSPTTMSLTDIMDEIKAGNNIVIAKEFSEDYDIKVGENLSVKFSLGITYANLSALLAGDNSNAHEDTYVINMSVIAIVSNMQGFASINLLGGSSSGVSYNIFISWETYEKIAIKNLPGGGTDMVFRQLTLTGNPMVDMVQPNWFNFSIVEAILNGIGGIDYYTTRMDYFTPTNNGSFTDYMTSVVGIQTNSSGNLKSDSLFGNNILVDKKIGYLGTTMEELLNTTEYVSVVDELYIKNHPGSGIGTNITIFPQEFTLKTIPVGNFPYTAMVIPYLNNYSSVSGSAVNLTLSDDVNLSFVSNQEWLAFNITTNFPFTYLYKAINVTIETSLNSSVDQLELEALNIYTNEFENLGSINNIAELNNTFFFNSNHYYIDPSGNLILRIRGQNSTYNSNYNLTIDSLKFGVAESTKNILIPSSWPQFEIIGIIEAPTLNSTERYNWYAGFETGADISGNSVYISYDKAREEVYIDYRGSDYSNDKVTSVLVHVDNPENLSTYKNDLLQNLIGAGGYWSIVDLKSFTLEIRTNVYDWFAWVKRGAKDEDVLKEITAYIEDRGYLIIFAFTKSFMSNTFRTIINLITFITNGLLIFAILIAMIGLVLHSLLSTMARRREIGMLRSIGLSRTGIIRTISGETLILALLGVFTGIFAGLIQGTLMVNSMPGGGFLTVTLTIPWLTIGILVSTVLITVIISSRYPARWAANLNIIDAIRTR